MRFFKSSLLAAAVVALSLLGASGASAFALDMTLNPASAPADSSTVVPLHNLISVDVYVDADPGLQFLEVGILYDDDGILFYLPRFSSQPSYILYTGGKGATYLIPASDPPITWNGVNLPGKSQVNIAFFEQAFGSASATGNNIWIGTLVFHVAEVADGTSTVALALLGNGSTIMQAYGNDVAGSTTVTGSFTVHAPEPSMALVGIAALSAVALLRSRRSRRKRA